MAEKIVELKICEACGVLWVRVPGGGVYCGPCVRVLRGFAGTGRMRRQESDWMWRPQAVAAVAPAEKWPWVKVYRRRTRKLLRRYRQSRLHAAVMRDFADAIGFCIDVERCLARLSEGQWLLVKRIAIQDYRREDLAAMLRTPLSTLVYRFDVALDRLSAMFLERGLMRRVRGLEGSLAR